MRIAIYAIGVLLAAITFPAPDGGQAKDNHPLERGRDVFANKWQISKGGLGLINQHLYIVVKSNVNELILDSEGGREERWKGKSASSPQVVIVFQQRVWELENTRPDGFDLSKAVIVSFEGSKIRFLDFQTMSGGYYERLNP